MDLEAYKAEFGGRDDAAPGWEAMNEELERVVIPIHGNKTLKIGLQRSLMKLIPVSENRL